MPALSVYQTQGAGMPNRYANNHCTIGDTVVKLALLLSVFLIAVFAQSERGKQQNVCVEQATCGACVAAGSRCGWCTQDVSAQPPLEAYPNNTNVLSGASPCLLCECKADYTSNPIYMTVNYIIGSFKMV